jgi:hypothetical protein
MTEKLQLRSSLDNSRLVSPSYQIQVTSIIPTSQNQEPLDFVTNDGDADLFGENFSLFGSPEVQSEEEDIPFMYISQPNKPPLVRIKVVMALAFYNQAGLFNEGNQRHFCSKRRIYDESDCGRW